MWGIGSIRGTRNALLQFDGYVWQHVSPANLAGFTYSLRAGGRADRRLGRRVGGRHSRARSLQRQRLDRADDAGDGPGHRHVPGRPRRPVGDRESRPGPSVVLHRSASGDLDLGAGAAPPPPTRCWPARWCPAPPRLRRGQGRRPAGQRGRRLPLGTSHWARSRDAACTMTARITRFAENGSIATHRPMAGQVCVVTGASSGIGKARRSSWPRSARRWCSLPGRGRGEAALAEVAAPASARSTAPASTGA